MGPPERGSPSHFFMKTTLSIFIDESGDFGKYEAHAPYYLFSMVFHDQSESISGIIENMDYRLSAITDRKLVHCGPLIRKEEIYQYADLDERRKIFNSLYFFTLKVPVSVKTIVVPSYSEYGLLWLQHIILSECISAWCMVLLSGQTGRQFLDRMRCPYCVELYSDLSVRRSEQRIYLPGLCDGRNEHFYQLLLRFCLRL